MATPKQVEALRKAHKDAVASGHSGLAPEFLAHLEDLTYKQVNHCFTRLRLQLGKGTEDKITQAQLAELVRLSGGLENTTDQAMERFKELTKSAARWEIQKLHRNRPDSGNRKSRQTAAQPRTEGTSTSQDGIKLWELNDAALFLAFRRYGDNRETFEAFLIQTVPQLHQERILMAWNTFVVHTDTPTQLPEVLDFSIMDGIEL